MKRLVFALLLLLPVTTHAQNIKADLPLAIEDSGMDTYLHNRKLPTLTIQINSTPDTAKEVKIKYTLVTFGADFQVKKFTETDSNGFARIVLYQNLPFQQIWLRAGDYLYASIYVNSDVTVTIDANKIDKDGVFMIGDGIAYSGTDGEFNEVMNEHVIFEKEARSKLNDDLSSVCFERAKLPASVFLKRIDSIHDSLVQIDNRFIRQYPKYGWAIKNETASLFYGNVCTAYWGDTMPENLLSKINEHKPLFTGNEGVLFYNYLFSYVIYSKNNSLPPFDDSLLFKNYISYDKERQTLLDSLKYYKQLTEVQRKVEASAIKDVEKKKRNLFVQEMKLFQVKNYIHLIDSLYKKPKSDILKTFLLKTGKDEFAQTYPKLINSLETDWCRQIAVNELAELESKQKKIDSLLALAKQLKNTDNYIGVPLQKLAFGADLYSLDSLTDVDDYIINLKSKFKNKALIIDFWATWCIPCISDLPFSKKLHETNRDLPIEYIYICTNTSSNIELWKNKVVGMEVPGTHIFMDEKMVEVLKSKFNNVGSGFPTYVVIDMNGKLRTNAILRMQLMNREDLEKFVKKEN